MEEGGEEGLAGGPTGTRRPEYGEWRRPATCQWQAARPGAVRLPRSRQPKASTVPVLVPELGTRQCCPDLARTRSSQPAPQMRACPTQLLLAFAAFAFALALGIQTYVDIGQARNRGVC